MITTDVLRLTVLGSAGPYPFELAKP
ncbi:hypothetical protein STPH2_3580 [Streptomyces sp. KO7888]|nr:hypothetical protein STPH1_3308 [Streptomyces sp. OM5714]NHI08216.1 hypothetical protein [Streptomyces sp. KO7888]